jgi:hypothetical protein
MDGWYLKEWQWLAKLDQWKFGKIKGTKQNGSLLPHLLFIIVFEYVPSSAITKVHFIPLFSSNWTLSYIWVNNFVHNLFEYHFD